jgi:LmbE family N-acetylglucosaminyl deacetylase
MSSRFDARALGTTVSFWAHPDDETYLAGGVMAALRDAGQRVVCVTATRGDGGNGLDLTGTAEQRSALGQLRTAELSAALSRLGVTEHHWLDYPDGGLAAVDAEDAVSRVAGLLEDVQAETVLTFGPEGFTGHPDHCTVSAWAVAAVRRASRPVRLLQAVMAEEDARNSKPIDERFNVYYLGIGPPVVPDDEVSLRLVLERSDLHRKVSALQQQASQTGELITALGKADFGAWVAVESFQAVLG